LTPNIARFTVGSRRKICFLAATTHTQPARIRRYLRNTYQAIMSLNEAQRLPYDITPFSIGLGRKVCLLTAAAHTQTAWIGASLRKGKLGLSKLWGMLSHVDYLLRVSAKPGTVDAVARYFVLGYSTKYSSKPLVCHVHP
jgi:hypothetical protein